jgi:hypothetical protein
VFILTTDFLTIAMTDQLTAVSMADFASLQRVTRAAVTGWKRRGLVALRPDGKVDVQASNERLGSRPTPYRDGERSPPVSEQRGGVRHRLVEVRDQRVARAAVWGVQIGHGELVEKGDVRHLIVRLEFDYGSNNGRRPDVLSPHFSQYSNSVATMAGVLRHYASSSSRRYGGKARHIAILSLQRLRRKTTELGTKCLSPACGEVVGLRVSGSRVGISAA